MTTVCTFVSGCGAAGLSRLELETNLKISNKLRTHRELTTHYIQSTAVDFPINNWCVVAVDVPYIMSTRAYLMDRLVLVPATRTSEVGHQGQNWHVPIVM